MSRRRKTKPQRPVSDTLEVKPKRFSTPLIVSVLVTLILGGIPFGLGKYIELNSPGPFDSGAFVYSAKHLLEGAKLGVDELSSARPNTLLANIVGIGLFGFNDIGPKIVQMALQLSALIFMFITIRNIFGPVASVVSTTVAAIYLSAPLIAKFGNVKEQFMIPFMIAAACCFLRYKFSNKHYWLVLTGFFAIQPYFFKPTGLSVLIAIGLFLLFENVFLRTWKTLALELGLFLTGYIGGLLIPGSLYLWQRTPKSLMNSLPVVLLKAGFFLGVIVAVIIAAFIVIKKIRLFGHLRQVSKRIWIAGLCLVLIATAVGIVMIKTRNGSENSDIFSYLMDIPIIQLLLRLYYIVDSQIKYVLRAAGLKGGYVSESWSAIDISSLAPQIFRYYRALSVPMLLAIASVITAACVCLPAILKKKQQLDVRSRVVGMLAVWWILDIVFVWGSPRSYEQYYLPLCGSAAVLSGYAAWKWQSWLTQSQNKIPAITSGIAAAIVLGSLSIPIFIGQRYSPDQGKALDYIETYGHRMRGFRPALKELPARKKSVWIVLGDYIRTHSTKDDTIYVWGWYPGIYVQAQRLAPVPNAFESDMHVTPPLILGGTIKRMVSKMEENPPKFIVDSRKRHFPNDRPPLELWPHQYSQQNPQGGRPIPNNPQVIAQYDALYKRLLAEKLDPAQRENNSILATTGWPGLGPWNKAMPDEAERYEAMKPFRDFVMNNYRIEGQYGIHILFERINRDNR